VRGARDVTAYEAWYREPQGGANDVPWGVRTTSHEVIDHQRVFDDVAVDWTSLTTASVREARDDGERTLADRGAI
jgi:hypothetical protein